MRENLQRCSGSRSLRRPCHIIAQNARHDQRARYLVLFTDRRFSNCPSITRQVYSPKAASKARIPSFRTITAPQTLRWGGGHLGDVALSVWFPAARKEALSRVLHPALLTHFGDVALSVRPSAPPQHTGYLLRATGMELFLTFSPNSSMRPLTKRHWASSRQLSGHLALRPRSGR